ncbi:MAG: hypothetical protein V7680_06485, partial [Parasphingorhabdus sp.]
GEDDEKRGDLDKALAKFTEAHRVTEALLRRDPNNSDRIFAHAKSENWLGHLAYWRKDYAEAASRTVMNKSLIKKLMQNPNKQADWVRHAGYSHGSDCARLITTATDPESALQECSQALEYIEVLWTLLPNDRQVLSDLANRHAWLADAYFANKQIGKGFAHRGEQLRLVNSLVDEDPDNLSWREQWAVTQLSYAELLFENKRQNEARTYARKSYGIANQLVRHDPDNARYADWRKRTEKLINREE